LTNSALLERQGSQKPKLWTVPPEQSNAAAEAVELAKLVGLHLDPWQVLGLESIMGYQAGRKWAAFEAAIIVARQNGKGGILEARELYGLFIGGEMDIVHSAHEAKTSKEAFRRMERYIRSSPELFSRIGEEGFKRSNEEVSITVRETGARLRYLTRSGSSGRGFTGDVLVLDEAYDLPAEMVGAILPIISARPNPQVIYTSSAGMSKSEVLWGLRRRALAGGDSSLAYCEWTAENVSLDEKGALVSIPIDEDNIDNWLLANPSIGVDRADGSGISIQACLNEQRAMAATPGKFARERLGVFDPLPADVGRDCKLPADAWAATVHAKARPSGRVSFAYDVDIDGKSASIGVASGTIGAPYVEVIEHLPHVGWLPDRLVQLVQDHNPLAVGYNAAGPALEQLGAVSVAFRAAGLSADLLVPLGQSEYRAACGGFWSDVVEGRLRRPPNQQPLDLAGDDATDRPLGEGWVWDRRQATVPISPLVAVTVARSLLPVEVLKPKPVFVH
jgi:hypothetical protein